jgi:tripartite ATP-independent transporter DctM subunit
LLKGYATGSWPKAANQGGTDNFDARLNMEPQTLILILLVTFSVCLLIGIPIAICIGVATLAYFLLNSSASNFILMLPSGMFQGIDSFVIMAVPFFMLAGELMNSSKVTDRLMILADVMVGRIRGSLAYANMIASFLFAGISGAAVSDVAALGSIEVPAMKKQGYHESFAAAVTVASSLVGPIIPPSIIMVIYGSTMGVSIALLFATGILPGLLMLVLSCAYVFWTSKKRNYPVRPERISYRQKAVALKESSLALLMPTIIIGGILGGVFTPTEAATVAIFYALFLGVVVYRELTPGKIARCVLNAGISSSSIFLIIAVSIAFKWVLSILNVPSVMLEVLISISSNKWVLITVLNAFFLAVGMFLEPGAAIILLGPIFAPAMNALGFDPLHFGIIMVLNMCIGLATPPVGLCLFAACSITKNTSLEKLSKEMVPFLVIYLVILAFITYFPGIALWLPGIIQKLL